jgi:EAL domain-containing protein (putative c-di-GMP-specific phosphodiesterase class I)
MSPDAAASKVVSDGHKAVPPGGTDGTDAPDWLPDSRAAAGASGLWMLESREGDEGSLLRTPIRTLPFRIGRSPGHSLVLPSGHVSKAHAEIYTDGLILRVRDLGSRNGTFVNRQAIWDSALREGDILHIGDFEFRLARGAPDGGEAENREVTLVCSAPLSRHFASGALMRRLIDDAAVTVVFQPIVHLDSSRVAAYEALGRGRSPGLPENPVELFDLASTLGPDAQIELSRLFRRKAVELARKQREPYLLFLNTHPAELEQRGLVESLEELRAQAPDLDLVLEIHESALAQTDFITWLRGRLMEINVGLAFDDFGAGQARLFELAEAPPHYLKFDRRFVTGLDRAPASRRRLVASLAAAARELLVQTVAEGVETPEEAAACVAAGFSLAQGLHFGKPAPLELAQA